MKQSYLFFLSFPFLLSIVFTSLPVSATVYEASSLHNSVSRSETVLDLFYDRWSRIQEMELYFDWYGKINWVKDFRVNAVNAGSGQTQEVPMTLVRAYGSFTMNIPLIGEYQDSRQERLKGGTGKPGKDSGKKPKPGDADATTGAQRRDEPPDLPRLTHANVLILGLTATGFHYGLTREGTLDRGDSGSEKYTDYSYTQFFDDIFAASLLYQPYFYVHCGVIINRMIEPCDDGTIDYTENSDTKMRLFISSNALSFLNLNSTVRSDEIESFAAGLVLNRLLGFFNERAAAKMPRLTVTYKLLTLFNDEPYDAVWVGSPFYSTGVRKSIDMPDDARQTARLHTLSVQLTGDILQRLYYDFFTEFQRPDESLYDRQSGEEIDYSPLREFRAILGWNFLGEGIEEGNLLMLSFGVSRYWDPAIAVHRDSGEGYAVWGGMCNIEGRCYGLGMTISASRNYSGELRKLTETVDKWVFEGSLYMSF